MKSIKMKLKIQKIKTPETIIEDNIKDENADLLEKPINNTDMNNNEKENLNVNNDEKYSQKEKKEEEKIKWI